MTSKLIRSQSEIPEADTADLVFTYNELTGKSIKKFESRAVAEVRVAQAILAAQDRDAHNGVAKGADPVAKTVKELPLKADEVPANSAINTTEQVDEESDVSKETSTKPKHKFGPMAAEAKKAAKKAAPAKKVAAKKAAPAKKVAAKKAAPKAERKNVYDMVILKEPDVVRRPQAESQRSKVLEALKKRKKATIDQLSDDVGFNARSFVHKLVFQGWAEVIAK